MAKKTKKRLEEDGKLHELYTGKYYATRKNWIAGLDDDKEVQLALFLEIIDMADATGEEQFEDYPFAFEYEIVVAYPGPEWMAKVERSTSPAETPEMALETSQSYGGGVPITHKMMGIEGGGMDLKRFTADQMTWKKETVTHGTVAAQRGPGTVFRYPMFATEDDAYEYALELFKTADVVMGVMIGFLLDAPINMMGNTGWETIQEQSK